MTSIHEAIAVFGSKSALARALGVSNQLVGYWATNGVPHWRQAALDAAVKKSPRDLPAVPPRRRRA